ncbi:hypothetical protein BV25DRAFT_980597 [Artomyces pyxidatus]|uniref:Uncharacterized protein n=1 Tax=Artomyces pyxidatus TaxID=48021 RepID=A0ACB8SW83_9AGAM|nr:hypothetical protein BV25DRAFT_980597 [Artomyces pyxidatus]
MKTCCAVSASGCGYGVRDHGYEDEITQNWRAGIDSLHTVALRLTLHPSPSVSPEDYLLCALQRGRVPEKKGRIRVGGSCNGGSAWQAHQMNRCHLSIPAVYVAAAISQSSSIRYHTIKAMKTQADPKEDRKERIKITTQVLTCTHTPYSRATGAAPRSSGVRWCMYSHRHQLLT